MSDSEQLKAKDAEIATLKADLAFDEQYVGAEMTMSDFQTAGQMREALNRSRERVKELEGGLSNGYQSVARLRGLLKKAEARMAGSELGCFKAESEGQPSSTRVCPDCHGTRHGFWAIHLCDCLRCLGTGKI